MVQMRVEVQFVKDVLQGDEVSEMRSEIQWLGNGMDSTDFY